MDEIEKKSDERSTLDAKKPYERPDIVWEEEYKPTAFGISCAKLTGQIGCVPVMG